MSLRELLVLFSNSNSCEKFNIISKYNLLDATLPNNELVSNRLGAPQGGISDNKSAFENAELVGGILFTVSERRN